jgi:signal transduction histidine kinase
VPGAILGLGTQLESARSIERLRQAQEAGLRAVVAVSHHIEETPELRSFFGRLSETVAGLVRARRAAFWRLHEDNGIAVEPDAFGFSSAALEVMSEAVDPKGNSIFERVVFDDEAYLGPLGGPEFDAYRARLDTVAVRNAVAVSWRAGDRILGALAAYDSDRDFTEEDAWVLRIAARAAGLVWQCKLAESDLRDAIALLEDTANDRRRLRQELVSVTARERRRLATDIHDDALQALTAVKLRLQRLRRRVRAESERGLVDDVAMLVDRADDALRDMLLELRPPESALIGGLVPAVRHHLENLSREAEIECEFLPMLTAEVPEQPAQIAFRVLREAATNAVKHAKSSRLVVALEEQDDGIFVRVSDDGRGFLTGEGRTPPGHLGLSSMQEHVELAGGSFTIDSRLGEGTTVKFWIPRQRPGRSA